MDKPQVPDEFPAEGLRPAGARPELTIESLDRLVREAPLAFAHGLRDAAHKRPITDNPYETGTLDSKAWLAAWYFITEHGPAKGGQS